MGKARKPTKAKESPSEPCQEGDTYTKTCPDGTIVVTKKCIGGEWIEQDWECPEPPCTDGETLESTCEDGTIIITDECIDGEWVPTDEECPEAVSYVCDLLQAVVYLNLCLSFWRGEKPTGG